MVHSLFHSKHLYNAMNAESPEVRRNRRVLGSPFKSPVKNTGSVATEIPHNPPVATIEDSPKVSDSNDKSINPIPEIVCPICNEGMKFLSQLNQHIDDVHQKVESTESSYTSPEPRISRRELQIDLLNGDKGFSLSFDESRKNGKSGDIKLGRDALSPGPGAPLGRERLTRQHWQSPTPGAKCSMKGCKKTLSVKQGIVNCRRCGKLFCNAHSNYKVRLKNGPSANSLPVFESLKSGVWSRVCQNCHIERQDYTSSEPKMEDLTAQFRKTRVAKNEDKEMTRNKIQKRFIKLTELLVDSHMKKQEQSKQSLFNTWNLFGAKTDSNDLNILEQEIDIVGRDNWMEDSKIHNCAICYVHFNMLTRKHHCRLCGSIVCDDLFAERKMCSIMVPINQLLDKLINLNYNALVRNNLSLLLLDDCKIRFRCCINCKNHLLYEWKQNQQTEHDFDSVHKLKTLFETYKSLIILKDQILLYMERFESLFETTSTTTDQFEQVREKLLGYLKDYENFSNQIKQHFYNRVDFNLRLKPEFEDSGRLISNVYQSSVIFLQDNLLRFKLLSDELTERTKIELHDSKKYIANSGTPPVTDDSASATTEIAHAPKNATESQPRLTKKQIRELREQLMVMNEQKFLVENLIEDSIKQRKFDELSSLKENKNELIKRIQELEDELGEFGF